MGEVKLHDMISVEKNVNMLKGHGQCMLGKSIECADSLIQRRASGSGRAL